MKKKLSDCKTLCGKGRLTKKTIVSMQTYYTGAIRNNPTSLSRMIQRLNSTPRRHAISAVKNKDKLRLDKVEKQ